MTPTNMQPLTGQVSTLSLSSDMARHAAKRHALVSQNIANADTPGYRALDVQSFQSVMDAKAAGIELGDGVIERAGVPSPNGNTVSLEDEMMRSAQIQNDYKMAIAIYRSALQMMKTSVSKNA